MKSRTIYLPAGLDLREKLPPELHRHVDGARYFTHLLTLHRGRPRDRRGRENRNGFINLKSAYLRRLFADDKAKTLTLAALRRSRVVECDGTFKRGVESLGYRLAGGWRDARPTAETFGNDQILWKLEKDRINRRGEIREPHHLWLFACLSKLRIDRRALAEIDANFATADEAFLSTWIGQRHIVEGIEAREWTFNISETMGRVTTGLTCLKRSLRKHLSVEDGDLVSIDVANAHPLLIGIVCRNEPSIPSTYTTKEMCSETERERANDRQDREPIQNRNSVISEIIETSLDLADYLLHCEKGAIYEFLVERMNDPKRGRGWVKKSLLSSCFYGENHYRGPIIDLMDREFPNLMAIVRRIKRENLGLAPRERFKELARRMLKLESTIIIDRAVPKCRASGVEWLASIHDSLVCRPCDVPAVKVAMMEAFAEYGVTPTLKVEPLSNVEADDELDAMNEFERLGLEPE